MDTSTIAAKLNTTPRMLRRFLRSKKSTFRPVGSGARYDLPESDLPVLKKRFTDWSAQQNVIKPTPVGSVKVPRRIGRSTIPQSERDALVWAEDDTPIKLDDLRCPGVRARVRAIARQQEARLDERLMAAGLHISQIAARDGALVG